MVCISFIELSKQQKVMECFNIKNKTSIYFKYLLSQESTL